MTRILLVDDNPSIHRIVASLLQPTGIEINYASSADEALALIAEEEIFDAALIDTSLPEIDGWQLLSRLRADPKTVAMTIVMMAGVLEDVDSAQVENAPIQAFLRKPVDLRDLAEKLQSLITASGETGTAPQPDIMIPSDLLILEEQDLAEETSDTETGPGEEKPTPEYPADEGRQIHSPNAAPVPYGEITPLAEEEITLELEDLDFKELDKLVVDTDVSEPLKEATELSVLTESDAPEKSSELVSLELVDTMPGDFDLSLLDEGSGTERGGAKADDKSAATLSPQESEQVPDGLYEALDRELEPLSVNASNSDAETLPLAIQDIPPADDPTLLLSNPYDESDETQMNVLPILDLNSIQDGAPEQKQLAPTTSAIVSELLSDPGFIDAISKAVAEKIGNRH